MLEVGCSEPLPQLRTDAKWSLVSGWGATHRVIIIPVSEQPDSLDLQVWIMKQNPSRLTRSWPAEIPFCASKILHNDANGALNPPGATLEIPYTAVLYLQNPGALDIEFTTAHLTENAPP